MTRSELKQLIRETIEEISADTARRAADKAKSLGRYKQADRLGAAAQKKDIDAVGGDPKIRIAVGGNPMSDGVIEKLGKTPEGKPGISVRVDNAGKYTLMDTAPLITTLKGSSVTVDRPTRMKLVKAFKSMGVNINPNKINIAD